MSGIIRINKISLRLTLNTEFRDYLGCDTIGIIGVIYGLYWGLYRGSIGIMEKKMATTV